MDRSPFGSATSFFSASPRSKKSGPPLEAQDFHNPFLLLMAKPPAAQDSTLPESCSFLMMLFEGLGLQLGATGGTCPFVFKPRGLLEQ